MPKVKLNKEDLAKIEQAVQEAESNTSGEIATAFTRESDNYAVYELSFAVICGFVYFMIMMLFSSPLDAWLRDTIWDYNSGYLLTFYGFSLFLVIALVYFLANFPFIDRMIVPKSVRQRKVKERALRYFMESGTHNTRDRTGILIFISVLERRVELLADIGIAQKIPQEKWNGILNLVLEGVKSGRLTEKLCEAVGECGILLAEHFPIAPDDKNELKDGIEILEK